MTIIPSQICLSSSKRTPNCFKFLHNVGDPEHEPMWKKCCIAPSSSQHVKFLQKQPMSGSHCLHFTPFSKKSFQYSLLDKNFPRCHFLNWSLQTLVSTIKIYHHRKWDSWCGNHTLHWKLEILNTKLEIPEISPPNIKFFMCLMHISIESHNDVAAMT